jgi:hypothetical protein
VNEKDKKKKKKKKKSMRKRVDTSRVITNDTRGW